MEDGRSASAALHSRAHMRLRPHRLALTAAAAVALTAPAAAEAGTPFTIGSGDSPSIYVQPDNGTAHVVWTNADSDTLIYCRVPRGATACAKQVTLPAPPGGPTGYPDNPFILPSPAQPTTLVVSMPIYATDKTFTWSSADNGDGAFLVAKIYDAVGQGTNATPPTFLGNSLVFAAGDKIWNSFGSTDSALTLATTLPGSSGSTYDMQVVRVNKQAQMLAVGNDLQTTRYWRMQSLGSPRSAGNWSATPIALNGVLNTTRVANNNNGTFLLGSRPDQQLLRKWNTTNDNFDDETVLANETGYINDLTAGPSGAVAAIWRKNEPSNGNRLRLAISGNGNAPYTVSTIARDEGNMGGMRVGLAQDNGGWAVYEGNQGGATRDIRLADLSAVAEPPVVQPPVTPPVTPPVAKVPSKTKTKTVSVNGGTISFKTPNVCVPKNKGFSVTLTWKRKKKKNNVFVKVRRADFYIGKRREKIDKKAPFRQTLRIRKAKANRTYSVRARAFIKVKKGKSPTKSIQTTVKTCK